jgi:hypothetical protein
LSLACIGLRKEIAVLPQSAEGKNRVSWFPIECFYIGD